MQLRTIPQQSWWVFQLIYIISFRSNLWWSNNIYFLIYLFHSLCFWWVFHVPKKWCPTWSLIYPLVDAHSRCLLTMVWIIFWISGYYPEIKPCYFKKNLSAKALLLHTNTVSDHTIKYQYFLYLQILRQKNYKTYFSLIHYWINSCAE